MTRDDTKALGKAMLTARQEMARRVLLAAVQAMGQSELTLLQFGCLMLLSDGEARTVGEVSEVLGRSMSATSRLLDQLVRRDLVDRAEDPSDRRARRVTIGAAGGRFLAEIMRSRARAELQLLEFLSPAEREAAKRGLMLLHEAAVRAGEQRKQTKDEEA